MTSSNPLRLQSTIAAFTLFAALYIAGPASAAEVAPAAPFKAGWTDQVVSTFTNGCVSSTMKQARQGFDAKMKETGASPAKPFPEQEVTAAVQPMCACIGQRLAESVELKDVTRDQNALVKSFADEALRGGRCKPGGILGAKILEQQKK